MIRTNGVGTHRGLVAWTRLALVGVLAFPVDQLVARETSADGLVIDDRAVSSSTVVVIARVDALIGLLVAIPVVAALIS